MLGKSAHTISCYENDKYFVRNPEMLATIAEHYKVTTDDLLGIKPTQHPEYNKLSENGKKEANNFIEFLRLREKRVF